MSSSNELEDSNDSKTTFIDKLLGEMKSEFNKQSKIDKNSDEQEDCEDDINLNEPPKLKPETEETQNSNSDLDTPPKISKHEVSSKTSDSSVSSEPKISLKNTGKGIKTIGKVKTNTTDTESTVREENSPDSSTEGETKPRIVLTFRTEKSKSTVTSNYADKDNSAEESSSPGRRSLRIKTNSPEEKDKKPEMESGLKRSARRRSKDCNESVLQSAIARKEKSYNETVRPQRLTRKLKPTAKILANLEMCQKSQAMKNEKFKQSDKNKSLNVSKNSPGIERQRFSYDKLEKGSEQAILESDLDYSKHDDTNPKMSEQLHRKFKRKHKHKLPKPSLKKIKRNEEKDSDSGSSSFSSHETEDKDEDKKQEQRNQRKSSSDADKPFRRSHRKLRMLNCEENSEFCEPLSGSIADENLTAAQPESSLVDCETPIKKCLCEQSSKIYIAATNSAELVFCTAVDSISNKIIGCNSVVSGEITMLRPSSRIPYITLCEVHKQRLLRHNCCPTCGLFCTQGKFVQCSANHQYHRDCQITIGEQTFCPHCGLQSPKNDIDIIMKCLQEPVFLPVQKANYPSAKMSFQSKRDNDEKRSLSPPLIPVEVLELMKSVEVNQVNEKFDIISLYESVKVNDYERVALILNNIDFDLNEVVPDNLEGMTVLHYASQEGLLIIIHMLLIAGAEQDVLDKEQNTPLMLAIQSFKNKVVKYLIKSGASINLKGTDGMSALHLAAKYGNLEACELLLSSSQNRRTHINSIDDGGWTPLVWACEHGHLEVTRYLLQNGADPLLRDVEQNVALHWAAFSGSIQITEMLLNNGCEVNAVNAHGDSPLHVAARQDKYNCVLMLLARGANVKLINKSEEKPLDCCVSNPGDCYTAISLNVHLQNITSNGTQRKQTILTNDISRGKEMNPVQCVNTVDDELKPVDFIYITENCITSDINIDRKITTLQYCNCEDRCTSTECLCSNNSLRCWYNDEGKLSSDFNYSDPPMLFECNSMCSCNAITCYNRVVQHGLTQRFQLFRTVGKGWGIRTLRMIPKGSYVCEYMGEIISDLEADQREDDSYLFDLDNRDGETYCIDARRYGNLSRFINHSCDPNLLPVRIYIDHQDLRFPRIAFFANRDIKANEELGFDYGEKFWIIKYKSFTCTCGYEVCKYSETTIKTTLENYQKRLLEEQELIPEIN